MHVHVVSAVERPKAGVFSRCSWGLAHRMGGVAGRLHRFGAPTACRLLRLAWGSVAVGVHGNTGSAMNAYPAGVATAANESKMRTVGAIGFPEAVQLDILSDAGKTTGRHGEIDHLAVIASGAKQSSSRFAP
jgi:hypothetical protein